jgi:hypothetical protein
MKCVLRMLVGLWAALAAQAGAGCRRYQDLDRFLPERAEFRSHHRAMAGRLPAGGE